MFRHTTIQRRCRRCHEGPNFPFAVLLRWWLGILLVVTTRTTTTTTGLKHTFHIHRTTRTIIGPIGIPFGFNPNGQYRLTVSNFQWDVAYHHNKHYTKPDVTNLLQNHLEAGFYLQRYDTVASFHQQYNKLVSHFQNHHVTNSTSTTFGADTSNHNATSIQETCSFAHWLSDEVRANIHGDRRQRRNLAITTSNDNNDLDDDLPPGLTNLDDAGMSMDDLVDGGNNNDDDDDDDPSNSGGSTGVFDPNDLGNDDPYASMLFDDLTTPTSVAPSNNNKNTADDDEVYFQQNSAYTAAQPYGIFMSMHSIRHTWYPNQPHVNYTFKAYVVGSAIDFGILCFFLGKDSFFWQPQKLVYVSFCFSPIVVICGSGVGHTYVVVKRDCMF